MKSTTQSTSQSTTPVNRNDQTPEQAQRTKSGAGAVAGGLPMVATGVISGAMEKMNNLARAAKELERALQEERLTSERLRREIMLGNDNSESLRRELQSQINESAGREGKFKAALAAFQENERALQARIRTIQDEGANVQKELAQYKAAWAGVLSREREAKGIIQESEQLNRRVTESEAKRKELEAELAKERTRNEQVERHAKSYQAELQNTLIRLHSAESKFNEILKEYQALAESRKNVAEEVAKIEASIQERYQWELVKERDKVRIAMEREINDQRESVREDLRAKITAEMEAKINFEKERNARIEREYAADRAKLQERQADVEQRLEKARNETEIARRELAIRTMKAEGENSQLGERLGAMKEEAKALRVELEKADEREMEIDRLNREIKELRGRYDAKFDAMTREYSAAKEAFQERELSTQEQILELQDELARFQDQESARAANKSSLDLLERFRRRFQE